MTRLKDRNHQIPGSLTFYEPSTKWKSTPWASFESIVQSLIAHRKGNAYNTAKLKLATDYQKVCDEVDNFNARICAANNWMGYIVTDTQGAPSLPKAQAAQHQSGAIAAAAGKAKRLWAGIRTLTDWYDSQEPAVPSEQSAARAKACSECPKNKPGSLETWFAAPAVEAIKRQVQKFADRKLTTPYDDKLHTCDACLCVNKLSVHAPLHLKLAHMSPDVLAELKLAPACWVVVEKKAAGL
jgi:hypothetical protein